MLICIFFIKTKCLGWQGRSDGFFTFVGLDMIDKVLPSMKIIIMFIFEVSKHEISSDLLAAAQDLSDLIVALSSWPLLHFSDLHFQSPVRLSIVWLDRSGQSGLLRMFLFYDRWSFFCCSGFFDRRSINLSLHHQQRPVKCAHLPSQCRSYVKIFPSSPSKFHPRKYAHL